MKLNFELNENRKELAYVSQKNKYQNIIFVLALARLLLIGILVSRQLRIVRMTREIRDVQNRLVVGELNQRELARENRETSGFRATLEQDKELLDDTNQ